MLTFLSLNLFRFPSIFLSFYRSLSLLLSFSLFFFPSISQCVPLYKAKHFQGIGPKKAIELVKKYKNIETILENLDKTKYPPPENWMFQEAR